MSVSSERARAEKILNSPPGTWFASDTLALARDVLSLADRLEAAERERDDWHNTAREERRGLMDWHAAAEDAERERRRAESDLAACRLRAGDAEARVKRLEEGLREIERFAVDEGGDRVPDLFPNEAIVLRTARSVLLHPEEEGRRGDS